MGELLHDDNVIGRGGGRRPWAACSCSDILRRRKDDVGALERRQAPEGAPGAAIARSLAPFLAVGLQRTGAAMRRLAFVGDLTPETGAADLLWAADAWAEKHGERTIHIVWAGEGDLKSVLVAQPLADNISQEFLPAQSPSQLAALFARCGMLAAPTPAADVAPLIAAAMAAGLPVLANSRHAKAARWILPGHTGWLFESRLSGALVQTLERAMATPEAVLMQMREWARERAVADQAVTNLALRWPWRAAPAARLDDEPLYQGLS